MRGVCKQISNDNLTLNNMLPTINNMLRCFNLVNMKDSLQVLYSLAALLIMYITERRGYYNFHSIRENLFKYYFRKNVVNPSSSNNFSSEDLY